MRFNISSLNGGMEPTVQIELVLIGLHGECVFDLAVGNKNIFVDIKTVRNGNCANWRREQNCVGNKLIIKLKAPYCFRVSDFLPKNKLQYNEKACLS